MRLAAPLALLLPLLRPGAGAPKAATPVWYGLLGLLLYSFTLAL